ncbi:hypothetical protein P3X46_034205 [Hevea brasiliensis]|uniref:DUF7794 domain-containing protein n=1 Tax=Hevea brasiliensis TaxID=3981 RepID=A0ABQ9K8P1_HEVBR|nr:uncharacterized protein LOC131176907 [Hevea brasiliensis]KAJ9129030.1 hypothetical protein P3X46_034205 [Hevea brasiliensis]KAJ9129031.1 hypothetical protein P3X46_034205 [Hevea brasiliensis]
MDFHIRSVFGLLIVSSILCSLARAETSGSVFFIDGQNRQYVRTPSANDVVQSHLMSPLELGAAVSVLLGFAPPATLSAAGSSKLNEVLMPNPFDRPRSVFMLEVTGVNDLVAPANAMFSNAYRSKVILDLDKAQIELPGEEVSVVSLDEKVADCNDEELSSLASWLGGSYSIDALEPQNGKLIIKASGSDMNLYVSKKADQEFIASLLALFRNSKRAIEMHEDLLQASQGPAELIVGRFDGIKALQEQYGRDVVKQGLELLLATLSKMLDSFQAAYKGQIVGVIICNEISSPESGTMLNLMLTAQPSARWLAEKEGSNATNATTIAEIALVRKTLAWVTGIILLISTLLGIYLLLNMPLTKDTLLYSNVKLD